LSKSPSLNSVCVHAGVYQTSITHQALRHWSVYLPSYVPITNTEIRI